MISAEPTPVSNLQAFRPWRAQLSALELAFAEMLLRHKASLETVLAAALAVRAELSGHSFVDLGDYADQLCASSDPTHALLRWPTLASWQQALSQCAWVATVESVTSQALAHGKALVCAPQGLSFRVYLRRVWHSEIDLATRLLAHVTNSAPHLAHAPQALGEPTAAALFRDQALLACAARALVERGLCLLTGGPGTGKTTAAARLIIFAALNWQQRFGRLPIIALCAPTGKAAARLAETFSAQTALLAREFALSDVLQTHLQQLQSCTVHRLLGFQAQLDRFTFDAHSPLAVDIVLLDEASMLSLALTQALLAAMTPAMQLILLGDADQLSAVESGAPFADILRAAKQPGCFSECATELTQQWRSQPELAALAQLIRQGNSDAPRWQQVLWQPVNASAPEKTAQAEATQLLQQQVASGQWDALLRANDLAAAWQHVNDQRVLCAVHLGPAGQLHANAVLEAALKRRFGLGAQSAQFKGRLVLATENDYVLGVMNGDIGLCWPDHSGVLKLWFAVQAGAQNAGSETTLSDTQLTAFAPELLPHAVCAFAMTVHKAQGSEFAHVTLILPELDLPAVHRALIYTAVTRAKNTLLICAAPAVLAAGIARVLPRNSGLVARLL
jgi:exodeoxyribonuclease V alpha subunit